MKINPVIAALVGVGALFATSFAGFVVEKNESSPSQNPSYHQPQATDTGKGPISTWPPNIDLRTQLAGTVWKAAPGVTGLRPGLDATLAFNGKDVGALSFRYEVNSHDGTVTIFFTRGDTQLMLLTEGGRHLRFTFRGEDYSYDFVSKTPPVYLQNQ